MVLLTSILGTGCAADAEHVNSIIMITVTLGGGYIFTGTY